MLVHDGYTPPILPRMGTWQKMNISAQKIKIYNGKALLAAALPQSRRFKGSSKWKSLSGAVSFFLEAVF